MQTYVPALSPWSLWKKTLFRFFALYLFIYITSTYTSFLWNPLVDFLGEHILQLGKPITVKPNGSGDTTYNYVQVFGIFLLAIIGTLLWTVVDHKRKNYDKLLYWLMVLVRYALAAAMIRYGFAKIFKTQFPFPGPYSLLQPLGESSPMGLVWKFMGYSTGYNYFTGIAEALAGVFLFFRRTATFGALLAISALANIVALNFFFDVPVKLYSSHLLLMALFVAAPDLKRLFSFFFQNKAVPAATLPPAFTKPWMRYTRLALKVLVLAWLGYTVTATGLFMQKRYGDKAAKPALYGAYAVETYIRNGDTLAPLTTDTTRWKLLTVNHERFISTQLMNDSIRHHMVQMDTASQTISWSAAKDSTQKAELHYRLPDKDHLSLQGQLHQDTVQILLRKIDLQQFTLVSRGFRWVNEYPYNR
ncbi:hypothetical protein [Rufibacter immobilis]|uniref:hypothetical protein n=1 Tax=Rufibacter immobilis TaxID=1348778 RepID=UPI0011CE0166|nr:hypothetical protein [Rufibacter immobilis]